MNPICCFTDLSLSVTLPGILKSDVQCLQDHKYSRPCGPLGSLVEHSTTAHEQVDRAPR